MRELILKKEKNRSSERLAPPYPFKILTLSFLYISGILLMFVTFKTMRL